MIMKKLLLLLLLVPFVLAQCTQDDIDTYLQKATTEITYPNYFGAAGEYQKAADCYALENNAKLANEYYEKAAQTYISAANELVAGGDSNQKGKSFELAGDSYSDAGKLQLAVDAYEKAVELYESNGFEQSASAVNSKITTLKSEMLLSANNVLKVLAIVVAVIVIIFIFIKIIKSKPASKPAFHEEEGVFDTVINKVDEVVSIPRVRENPETKMREENARKRATEKLRNKFLPKF